MPRADNPRKRRARIHPGSLILFVLLWMSFIAPAAAGQTAAWGVDEFLTPRGEFDLEAARRSAFEGNLDLSGLRLETDPDTGAPILRPEDNRERAAGDENWWCGFHLPGVGGDVYALAVYDGKLIVGGYFNQAGGMLASNIASHGLRRGVDRRRGVRRSR